MQDTVFQITTRDLFFKGSRSLITAGRNGSFVKLHKDTNSLVSYIIVTMIYYYYKCILSQLLQTSIFNYMYEIESQFKAIRLPIGCEILWSRIAFGLRHNYPAYLGCLWVKIGKTWMRHICSPHELATLKTACRLHNKDSVYGLTMPTVNLFNVDYIFEIFKVEFCCQEKVMVELPNSKNYKSL